MTRLSTNGRLSYTPEHRETPIEGIGGMYRFWNSIDAKDRDKLVELFEFGHENPDDSINTSRMDWQSIANQQKDAYENGYPGPVELMARGWDYGLADNMKDHSVEDGTDRLINATDYKDGTGDQPDFETAFDEIEDSKKNQIRPEAKPAAAAKEAESARAHAQARNWRAGNYWGRPSRLEDEDGNPLVWPVARHDYEEREEL